MTLFELVEPSHIFSGKNKNTHPNNLQVIQAVDVQYDLEVHGP